jgi:hypothetical protein
MTEFGQINQMPRRELRSPTQVEQWLADWGQKLKAPGKMILISWVEFPEACFGFFSRVARTTCLSGSPKATGSALWIAR